MRHVRLALATLLALSPFLRAMGTEDFGPATVEAVHSTDLPTILPLLNNPHRVYHTWTNGSESFYFAGDLPTFNAALYDFAHADLGSHEVVLRPGPGFVSTFAGDKGIPFTWTVQWTGGISKSLTNLNAGSLVWNAVPVLSLYITDAGALRQLVVPRGVTVVTLRTLAGRYKRALASTDVTVRGWTCGELARLDPANSTNADAIALLLRDPDPWVVTNAATALTLFGPHAAQSLPALQEALATHAALKPIIDKSIAALSVVQKEPTKSAKDQNALLEAIQNYADARH